VLEAANGAAALVAAHQHQGPIHVLVTDVVMPGLRGPGLAAALLRERPDLKIVFMSGYTDPAHVSDAMRFAGSRFLQKPFASTALVNTVRELLDAPDPAPQGSWVAGNAERASTPATQSPRNAAT
jgi:YesN/AraC family two-component response regulator